MTIRPSDDQVNPVTLNLITLLLTNCDTMEIREGDTANIMLQVQLGLFDICFSCDEQNL